MTPFDSESNSAPVSTREIAQYRRDGFLVLRQMLPDEQLAALRDASMRAWEQEKDNFKPGGSWLQNALLPNVHHLSDVVRRYYFMGPLVDVAAQLIGPNIKGATSQLTFKMRGNRQTFHWHQDNGYGQLEPATAISTLTALDDTDEENGCLWVIPGSHQLGQIDVSDQFSESGKSQGAEITVRVENEEHAIPLPLSAGDALLLHCHTLHKSQGNLSPSRDRRILFMRYADADAVEVYNQHQPRLGPLLRGTTRFAQVARFEHDLRFRDMKS